MSVSYFVSYRWFVKKGRPKTEYYAHGTFSHSYAYDSFESSDGSCIKREGGIGNCIIKRNKKIVNMDDIVEIQHQIEQSTKWKDELKGNVQVVVTNWQRFEN